MLFAWLEAGPQAEKEAAAQQPYIMPEQVRAAQSPRHHCSVTARLDRMHVERSGVEWSGVQETTVECGENSTAVGFELSWVIAVSRHGLVTACCAAEELLGDA
jgi:hypothetical protein